MSNVPIGIVGARHSSQHPDAVANTETVAPNIHQGVVNAPANRSTSELQEVVANTRTVSCNTRGGDSRVEYL